MRFLFILCTIFFVSSVTAQQSSVFVAAHPDDWQLFMNPNAYDAVADSNNHVIFLHVTAGDAGFGMGYSDYTLAREEGSKRAIRFLVNAAYPNSALGQDMNGDTLIVQGKAIKIYKYANTTSYFLRLPDGNFDGAGYPIHQETSLRKIHAGEIDQIRSVDSINTFTYEELHSILEELIYSKANNQLVNIHIAETDTLLNPGDHSDHMTSSFLVQDIVFEKGGAMLNYYVEYHTNNMLLNVHGKEYLNSVGTWGATISGISDFGHYSTWDEVHNSWLGRQYYRSEEFSMKSDLDE